MNAIEELDALNETQSAVLKELQEEKAGLRQGGYNVGASGPGAAA